MNRLIQFRGPEHVEFLGILLTMYQTEFTGTIQKYCGALEDVVTEACFHIMFSSKEASCDRAEMLRFFLSHNTVNQKNIALRSVSINKIKIKSLPFLCIQHKIMFVSRLGRCANTGKLVTFEKTIFLPNNVNFCCLIKKNL